MSKAVAYLFLAVMTWVGLPAKDPQRWERENFERPDAAEDRLRETAAQTWAATANRRDRLRFATELEAVAFEESHLRRYVDDGTCDLRGQIKALHPELAYGDCDGGKAFTVWQMWPHRGSETGPELLADRTLAAQVAALRWAAYPQAWTRWKEAKERAAAWLAAHPPPSGDLDKSESP